LVIITLYLGKYALRFVLVSYKYFFSLLCNKTDYSLSECLKSATLESCSTIKAKYDRAKIKHTHTHTYYRGRGGVSYLLYVSCFL